MAAQCTETGGLGTEVPYSRVPPNIFWGVVRGFTTALPNSDMFGHDNILCDDFVLSLL